MEKTAQLHYMKVKQYKGKGREVWKNTCRQKAISKKRPKNPQIPQISNPKNFQIVRYLFDKFK
jgi:hypothetical protein